MGKPSPITAQVALEVMGLKPEDCILIGDRLETDIRMGLEAGMKTALVRDRRNRRQDPGSHPHVP